MVVSSPDSPDLRAKLAAAQRREREAARRAEAAEAEAARAADSAAAAAPVAELRRLRTQLESSQAEADMLRSRLAQRERERSPSRMGGGGSGSQVAWSGLASELEEAEEGGRLQQLEAQVRLGCPGDGGAPAAAAAGNAGCQTCTPCIALWCCQVLPTKLFGPSPRRAGALSCHPVMLQVEVLEREVARLRGEKAAAREECRRLRQQGAQDPAEIEHLTQRLLQLAGGGGSKQPSRQASPVKQAGMSAREQQQGSSGGSPATLEQQPKEPARGGIGSPIEEPAAADGQPAAAGSTCSPSAAAAGAAVSSPGRRAAPGTASGTPAGSSAASPSAADMRHFRREMQHTLHTAERPGVVSRFPHSLGSFLALRPDLEASPLPCSCLQLPAGCTLLARHLASMQMVGRHAVCRGSAG